MAIKKFNDYEQVTAYSEIEQLPRGGYVCKITGAKTEDGEYGQRVKIAFDIAEGDHTGYFQAKFDRNTNEDKKWPGVYSLNVPSDDGSERDNWTKRRFKTFTNALEDSNDGYHFDWDETKFKGKLIGLVFNYREYEFNGQTGMTPNVAKVVSVSDIKENRFKIPEDKYLKNGSSQNNTVNQAAIDGFMNVPSGEAEEIPF